MAQMSKRRRLSTVVAVVMAAGPLVAAPASPAAAAAPKCGAHAQSEAAAQQMAAACGSPVAVDASRTEYTQVLALPDGRRRFETSVVPQRTLKNGIWSDIDLGLVAGKDGRLRPKTSVSDVTFSAGGTGPLVVLTRTGKTFTLSWPGGPLPRPAVSRDSATYTDLLPDVDLVMRATRTGFTHVLVVKTAAAAANPAVRALRFDLGGDARVSTGADGSLQAVADGVVVASAEPAVMWDSRTGSGQAQALRGAPDAGRGVNGGERSRSSAAQAGDASRTAAVNATVSDGDLLLRPDADLLDPATATFPVFIDPAWSVAKTKWAYATNDGSSNTDYTVARVGKNPDTGALYRSFFEFSTTANNVSLKGKHIESAYMHMKVDHTWSCGDTPNSMFQTPVINATMKASWTSMKLSTWLSTASSHANEAGGCDKIYPDMDVNFSGTTVTSKVQQAADGNWNTLTVGFCSCDNTSGANESTQDRWKKYLPNEAKLYVDYDSKPTAPTGLLAAGVACPASGVLTIGTLSPTLAATFNDADTSDSLTGTWEWIEVPAGGIGTVTDTSPARLTPPAAKTGITPNTQAISAAVSVTTGKTYAFRAKATDKAPYSITGPWSSWCQFAPDTTVPPSPSVAAVMWVGPGQKMNFDIWTTTTDVVKFRYGWSNPPSTEVAAIGVIDERTKVKTKNASITVTVPAFGKNTLWVRSIDATGNLGNLASNTFTASSPAPPVARWGLETYPGISQTAALADAQASPVNSPLTAAGVTWTSDAHLLGGQVFTPPATTSATTAQTSGPVVDTAKSFSVAAWVRRTDTSSTYRPILSQEGTTTSGLMLFAEKNGDWTFYLYDTDSTSVSATTLQAPSTVGVWTHVAASYDAVEQKVRLYINGVLAAEKTRTAAPWSANGKFHIGWSKFGSGSLMTTGIGQIADVQVFDRALVPQDFTGQLASDPTSSGFNEPGMLSPVQVGNWNFEAGVGCYVADVADTCESPDQVTAWNRWQALSLGSEIGNGHSTSSPNGLLLDGELDDDWNPATPPVATQEYSRSAYKIVNGDGTVTWQDTPVLRTDQSFTISAWVKLDRTDTYQVVAAQDGTVNSGFYLYYAPDNGGMWKFKILQNATTSDNTNATFAETTATDVSDTWHHLVGVLDVEQRRLKIYVDGDLRINTAMNANWQPWQASGRLTLGCGNNKSNLLYGQIDDVAAYQGAMNDAAVKELNKSQS